MDLIETDEFSAKLVEFVGDFIERGPGHEKMIGLKVDRGSGINIVSDAFQEMLNHSGGFTDASGADNDGKAVRERGIAKKVAFEFSISDTEGGPAEGNDIVEYGFLHYSIELR